MASDISVEESHIGPVVRSDDDSGPVVLYLHGEPDGPERALDAVGQLARQAGATVVCPRYRLTFPDALIDAHAAYNYCQAAGPVVVVGERMGAALATALLVQLRDSEATPPRCAVLLSALLDLTLDTRSVQFNTCADPAFDLAELRRSVTEYAKGTPLTDSRLSPLYANLHGLPPVQLLVASTDPLLDDSLAFATRAARSRVPVDLRVWPEKASFLAEAVTATASYIQLSKAPAAQAAATA